MKQEIQDKIKKIKNGEIPKGYKKIGHNILPENWELIHFNKKFNRLNRKNEENNQNVLTISAQYGLIKQTEFYNNEYASEDKKGYSLLYNGDFAYNKSYSGSYLYGAIKRLDKYDKGIVSPLYICFETKENTNSEFYLQYFESGLFNYEIYRIAQEGARNHGLLNISISDFFDTIIPLPAVEEQRRIADILGECDRVIELKQKLINEEEKRKKYLMSALLNPDSGVRLPGFSDPWKSAKLGELGIFSKGGNLSKENINGKKYPCILYGNLYTHYQETIKKIYFYTDNEDCVYGYKNDLLFPTSTTVDGDSLISPSVILVDKIALGGDIIKLSLNNNISGLFLSYYINGPYKKQMAKVAQGSTIIHLQKKHIENMKVNYPCIEEQKAIADILSCQDSKIELLKKELEEWKTKKKSLMQLLLTGLVRTGEINE